MPRQKATSNTEKLAIEVIVSRIRHGELVGTGFLLDKTLGVMETELDPARFFRANRALLVFIDAAARCSSYGKGKLLLALRPPVQQEVVVSQERAAAFRE